MPDTFEPAPPTAERQAIAAEWKRLQDERRAFYFEYDRFRGRAGSPGRRIAVCAQRRACAARWFRALSGLHGLEGPASGV